MTDRSREEAETKRGEQLANPMWKEVRRIINNCEHPKGERGCCPDCLYRVLSRITQVGEESFEEWCYGKDAAIPAGYADDVDRPAGLMTVILIERKRAWLAAWNRARAAAIEQMKKALEDVDPLKAIADWEDSEDIAYAVKKRMIAALRALSQQNAPAEGKDG